MYGRRWMVMKGTMDHTLWRNTLILKTSTLKMTFSTCLSFLLTIFSWFCRKRLPADSRYCNGYELRPSSRRHLFIFTRSGFHTVSGKEIVSISVQSHLQVHRWCIAHKLPRIRKLSGSDVSCWTWDQGHHREHHFCFMPRCTTVDWEGW